MLGTTRTRTNEHTAFLFIMAGSFEHVGNKRLRVLVNIHLQSYMKARSKSEKARVMSMIVMQVRDATGSRGGFVKKLDNGEWIEIGLIAAREKVGKCC